MSGAPAGPDREEGAQAPSLRVEFTFNPASGLFTAALANGTRFSVAPINVSGKLGSNLDLLRQFTMRDRAGEAPAPHVCAPEFGAERDRRLVETAIAEGKLQRVGVIKTPRRESPITLEELDL